jgi:hypothetical protein
MIGPIRSKPFVRGREKRDVSNELTKACIFGHCQVHVALCYAQPGSVRLGCCIM